MPLRALSLLALAAALAVPARAAAPQPVLGIDWNGPRSRLAWFDSQTLAMLPGRKAPLAWHVGAWSFDADHSVLAIGGEGVELRFVDARRMRVLGDLRLARGGNYVDGVSWLRPDRLLALVDRPGDATAVVVDPQRRTVLRRAALDGVVQWFGRLPDSLVLLLAPGDGIGPARLATVDAAGRVRRVTLDRIAVGSEQEGAESRFRSRRAGLAVDGDGRAAYVVAAEGVARVDLDTLAVSYHAPERALQKAIDGPTRQARWLGGGTIAVSGADYAADGATPYGLRLVDVRTWKARTVDADAAGFQVAQGLLLVRHDDGLVVAYDTDGAERFRLRLARETWLSAGGPVAAVCATRDLVGLVDLATGAETAAHEGRCPDLLAGRSSDY